jgi:Spy/CpxP family protein refolding chaperone
MTSGPKSLAQIRLQSIAVILGIFVVGGLVGMTVERARSVRDSPRARWERRGERGERGPRERGALPPPYGLLDLTEQQRQQITEIMENRRTRIDDILAETLPQLRAERDSVRVLVEGILTEEQREELQQYDERFGRGFRSLPGADRLRPRGGPPRLRRDSQ